MTPWSWLVIGVLALAAVMLGLAMWLGRGDHMPSWRGARLFRVSRLAARFWASWLGARIRRLGASKARREHLDAAQREANARRLAETMGNMKGAFMKLGQMVSFVSDDIPEEYRRMLQSLQAEAPAMDFPIIRDAVETELGKPLERAFARFDEEPLAAASIGQVHRAQLPSGEEVVVKVQYPGVDRAIRSDMQNVGVLHRMVSMMYPKLDPRPVVEEMRQRISEELDYRLEARNQTAFHELYRGHPYIRVPEVFPDWSTGRVLTSEYVDARRFDDIVNGAADSDAASPDPTDDVDPATGRTTEQTNRRDIDQDHWGEILFRFVFGSTMCFRVFNGDPHPGNYLFDHDGRMVFLDFGCTKYFPAEMHSNWRKLVAAHLGGDKQRFRDLLVALSFVGADSALTAEDLYEYFGYFYESFRSDRTFTFTREYNRKSFRMVFRPEGPFTGFHKQLNMPPDFVFVNRIQWGVMSILGTMQSTGNWHRIQREYVFGESPSTDMGREIAAWREGWLRERGLEGKEFFLTDSGIESRAPEQFLVLSA